MVARAEHRAPSDPRPLGDHAAAPDESVVLDHDRHGVGWLEHAADAHAARQVHPSPIWAQEPTVAQVSTMVPAPTQAPMFT